MTPEKSFQQFLFLHICAAVLGLFLVVTALFVANNYTLTTDAYVVCPVDVVGGVCSNPLALCSAYNTNKTGFGTSGISDSTSIVGCRIVYDAAYCPDDVCHLPILQAGTSYGTPPPQGIESLRTLYGVVMVFLSLLLFGYLFANRFTQNPLYSVHENAIRLTISTLSFILVLVAIGAVVIAAVGAI